MTIVYLGNTAVREVIGADDDGAPIHRRYSGQSTVISTVDDSYTDEEKLRTFVHDDGHWSRHSSRPPAWVESDDPVLADGLAANYGCPIGRPTDWVNKVEQL